MKVALVCIAKNEGPYIMEWIKYHLKLGFTHVYVYCNNWVFKTDHPFATTIQLNGECMQLPAYNHFLDHYGRKYDWCAFFDVDEFLVLHKTDKIYTFLEDYDSYPAVCVNWVLFGGKVDDEAFTKTNGVLQRFIYRASRHNSHIKSILNLKYRANHVMTNPHYSSLFGAVDCEKNPVVRAFNPNGSIEIAQLNHYFCKTYPEFVQKVNRGRADISKKRLLSEYSEYNFNSVKDTKARDFMYGE
jgi:hypothetical protein